MSAHNRSVVFTADARADFTNIMLSTAEQWGDEQQDRYSSQLTQAIDKLAHFPSPGESRDDISPGLRSRSMDHLAIFYRVLPEEIVIVRILHVRMNADVELNV